MKIKICDENKELIESQLKLFNNKTHAHCYNTYDEILDVVNTANSELDNLELPISHRNHIYCYSVSGSKMLNSYKYKRIATKIRILYKNKNWYLVHIINQSISLKGGYFGLYLSEAQSEYVINKVRSKFHIADIKYQDIDELNEIDNTINITGI